MSTLFATVYNRFLGMITDDLYLELTPEDTLKDLRNLLIAAIPGFEFPRVNLDDYFLDISVVDAQDVDINDFVIGPVWDDIDLETPKMLVDKSCFNTELSSEEVNILAILMRQGWLQRQITSCENTRMKYSGPDFRMTSQANHLAKLMTAMTKCQQESLHYQRLYKRRKKGKLGIYESNWSCLREVSALED